MLAKNPLTVSPCWSELTPNNHHFVVGGETLGLVYKLGNVYHAEADRSSAMGRRHGRVLRLGSFPSMLAGMMAVQDALTAPDGDPASDAAALGREARDAFGSEYEFDLRPDNLTVFDVLQNRWVR